MILQIYSKSHSLRRNWEKIMQHKALLGAFLLADYKGEGDLGYSEVVKLLFALHPTLRHPTAVQVHTERRCTGACALSEDV